LLVGEIGELWLDIVLVYFDVLVVIVLFVELVWFC
jgi:hypothetical protein